jgi:hypothetical protein
MRIKQEVDKVCVRVVTEEDSFLNSQLEIKEEQLDVDSFTEHRTDRTAKVEYQNYCTEIHSNEASQQRQVFTELHQIVLTSIDNLGISNRELNLEFWSEDFELTFSK